MATTIKEKLAEPGNKFKHLKSDKRIKIKA